MIRRGRVFGRVLVVVVVVGAAGAAVVFEVPALGRILDIPASDGAVPTVRWSAPLPYSPEFTALAECF